MHQKPHVPLVDLETIHETLTYIRDDIQRMPGFERAAEHLTEALAELTAAERRRLALSASALHANGFARRKH